MLWISPRDEPVYPPGGIRRLFRYADLESWLFEAYAGKHHASVPASDHYREVTGFTIHLSDTCRLDERRGDLRNDCIAVAPQKSTRPGLLPRAIKVVVTGGFAKHGGDIVVLGVDPRPLYDPVSDSERQLLELEPRSPRRSLEVCGNLDRGLRRGRVAVKGCVRIHTAHRTSHSSRLTAFRWHGGHDRPLCVTGRPVGSLDERLRNSWWFGGYEVHTSEQSGHPQTSGVRFCEVTHTVVFRTVPSTRIPHPGCYDVLSSAAAPVRRIR